MPSRFALPPTKSAFPGYGAAPRVSASQPTPEKRSFDDLVAPQARSAASSVVQISTDLGRRDSGSNMPTMLARTIPGACGGSAPAMADLVAREQIGSAVSGRHLDPPK